MTAFGKYTDARAFAQMSVIRPLWPSPLTVACSLPEAAFRAPRSILRALPVATRTRTLINLPEGPNKGYTHPFGSTIEILDNIIYFATERGRIDVKSSRSGIFMLNNPII